MVEEFPGNSRRPINPKTVPPAVSGGEEKKFEKVVTGNVVRRKKPLGRRILDMLFSGDSSSVVGYLAKEVLVPALQNLVTDFVTQGVERAVFGEVRTQRRTGTPYRPGSHISYNNPATVRTSYNTPPTPPARRPISQPSSVDIGEIIFEEKINAQVVAEKLFEIVEEYNMASVANLNELVGQTSQYTDNKYGWTDLSSMEIKRVREGWLLVLPEPIDLR